MNTNDYEERGYEERGSISRITMGDEDHGIETVYIMCGGDGWGQGFGGLVMKDRAQGQDFLRSLAAVFGCSPDGLVGQECVALRPMGHNSSIEGLRSIATGRTFTISAWRTKHGYPAPTPLESAIKRCHFELEFLARRVAEESRRLKNLPSQYRHIEGEAP